MIKAKDIHEKQVLKEDAQPIIAQNMKPQVVELAKEPAGQPMVDEAH
jgi:hypothetical protein